MTCSHVRIVKLKARDAAMVLLVRCLDCDHSWTEHPIAISDIVYDATLAIMAQRLDNK